MLDEYLYGTVDRISPEAPVAILNWTSREACLGGAANVASNVAQLGGHVLLAGLLGSDAAAGELSKAAETLGIDTAGVLTDADRPTTVKTRVIAHGQQVVRIDKEARTPVSGPLAQKLVEFVRQRLPFVEGLVLSDYAKGVLTADVCRSVIDMASAAGRKVLVDPKGDDFTKYRGAFLLTPNKTELGRAALMSLESEDDIRRAVASLFPKTECEAILVTRGSEGMSLHAKSGDETYIGADARQFFDITGAGDTVISTVARVFFAGESLEISARLANVAGGIKVGKQGTAAVSLEEISAWIRGREHQSRGKLLDLSQVKQLASLARSQGKKIVFTNGCFDLLHAGHVHLLQQAKALGHVLIVAINDDASVKQLKGDGRPVISARERAAIIGALESVDHVVLFPDLTPLSLIQELRPDVLVKGANYSADEVVGRKEVEKYGGRVVLIPLAAVQSSSKMIREIVARYQFSGESSD